MRDETIEKIYAGFLGMDAGMRLGAPVESPYWTYDRLKEYFGDIRDYVREYRHYAADDDVNGPVIFLRSLTDCGPDFTAEDAGETWLNYTRKGRGMFWWGGEDMSTEHRAYMNLKRGIKAPESGSITQNGRVAAEQIGGQIFIDTWGFINPGDPERAAEFARRAASVSHDGEGLHGAAFMAAAIAAAFTCSTVDEILDTALTVIPADCDYRRVVDGVRAFHAAHPEDFRACRDYVDREWGADKYPGYCHIVPNGGICALALLYGGGELGRCIEIAVMCGFDTDCNASSVGSITGVLHGLEGVPRRYRAPINDGVVLSSASGYLNMLDSAAFAKELAALACSLRGEELPGWVRRARPGEMLMDFELPGSTHSLELSDHAAHELRNVEGKAHTGRRCLEMMIDGKVPTPADFFFKGCYVRSDFSDERYSPVFSPRVCPGQRVSCWMRSEQTAEAAITVTPYLTTAMGGQRMELPPVVLPEGEWTEIAFAVPELTGDQVHDVGWTIAIDPAVKPWTYGKVYIDDITVSGPMDYTIDPAIQRVEFEQVTPFSFNDADGALEDGMLVLRTEGEGQAFTGNYYMRDQVVKGWLTPGSGTGAMLLLRGQGCRRFYALGLDGPGRAVIARYDSGVWTELASAGFPWEKDEEYILKAEAVGERLTLSVDGQILLTAEDSRFAYGMAGICHQSAGESRWGMFHIAGTV